MIFICSRKQDIPYTPQEPYHIIIPEDYLSYPNISDKIAYRHLRGMYIIWKNPTLFDNPQEVTIFQERRHLNTIHTPPSYDVIQPQHINFPSMYQEWCWNSSHPAHRKEYMDELLCLLPKMQQYATIHPAPTSYYHNMGVYTWEIYDQLCNFLFTTLDVLETRINIDPTGDNHCYAFLAERLQNYFFWDHPEYKVFESPLVTYPS